MCIDSALVEHGAPTLAGLKTANLFPVKTGGQDITPALREANRVLSGKGIKIIPMKKSEKSVLVYLFRPDRLEEDLKCPEAESMLREKGYPCDDPALCLCRLIRHLEEDDVFPHEVGLFLGYPPSDVKCFMQDSRDGVKCCGCWKAYSNQEEAERTFTRFKICTDVYRAELKRGRSLESLAVDTRKHGRGYRRFGIAQ